MRSSWVDGPRRIVVELLGSRPAAGRNGRRPRDGRRLRDRDSSIHFSSVHAFRESLGAASFTDSREQLSSPTHALLSPDSKESSLKRIRSRRPAVGWRAHVGSSWPGASPSGRVALSPSSFRALTHWRAAIVLCSDRDMGDPRDGHRLTSCVCPLRERSRTAPYPIPCTGGRHSHHTGRRGAPWASQAASSPRSRPVAAGAPSCSSGTPSRLTQNVG